MRKRTLLVAGLVALAASLIGPAVQASITGETGWWGQMTGYGHMGWRGGGLSADNGIEGADDVVVIATEFAFSPAEITLAVDTPVNLVLTNEGDLPHDLVIPELDVHLAARPGRQTLTAIEIADTGSYEFLCSYPEHEESGMTGILKVTPNA